MSALADPALTRALLAAAIALCAASGLPALLGGRRRGAGRLTLLLLLAGCAAGLVAALGTLATRLAVTATVAVASPFGLELAVRLDPLAGLFLLPVFLLSALGAIYGEEYWALDGEAPHPGWLRLLWGVTTAGMATLVVARSLWLFLLGWEAMALGSFLLILVEERRATARRAAWIYLAATHTATLALLAFGALLAQATGTLRLDPLPLAVAHGPAGQAMFLCALLAFGVKAGIMPLHVWLPQAHAAAPSHVSALLSGAVIKIGIYALVRLLSLYPQPPEAWGWLLLALGIVSTVLGVAYALGQHDVKKLLAYHSVENVGIIVLGIGLGTLGRATHQTAWIVLGLGGALLHVLNHALFKGLLFLGAGSVVHHAGSRDLDRLGGLWRRMPATGACFLIGAAAICALPPLNGFVSEWLLYLGLFAGLPAATGAAAFGPAAAVPALALAGGLALACFAKVFGAVFLGQPRTPEAAAAHESGPAMVAPMVVLAALCVAIGVAPRLVAAALDGAVAIAAGGSGGAGTVAAGAAAATPVVTHALHPPALPALADLAPLGALSRLALVLVLTGGLLTAWLARRFARAGARTELTWDCGYAAPTPRMQYTATSFARWLVGYFAWALRPHERIPRLQKLFPRGARVETHVDDVVLERLLVPAFGGLQRATAALRWLHQGRLQTYIAYILLTLLLLLALV